MVTTKAAAVALGLILFGLTSLAQPASAPAFSLYVVQPGDTLTSIASRAQTTVSALAQTNSIEDPDHIYAGQTLALPELAPEAAAPSASGYEYTVQPGDNLIGIASRFGVSPTAIAEANGLGDPDFITIGQSLTIPDVPSSPAAGPFNPQIGALLEEFALAEGLDPGLVMALAYLESGWRQDAVSVAGARGVMQIMPATGAWLEQEVFGYDLDIEYSMYDNIKAGTRYLRILFDATGDVWPALASYYQGYAKLSQGIVYQDTVQYVADVLAIKATYWP